MMKNKIQSAIRAGKMSLTGIAKVYGVPLSYVITVFEEMAQAE